MGCNTSKLDRLPAVALCRDRCKFMDEALVQSYTLADAHVAHMDSLRTLGPALIFFFQHYPGEENSPNSEITHPLSKSAPPRSLSSSESSDSDAKVLHSESETDDDAEKESQLFSHNYRRYDYLHHDTVLSSVPDNVTFMTYVKPIYDSYSPTPVNAGNFSDLKPPSPPPPSTSAWDFLNFFEPYEKFQVRYSSDGYIDTVGKENGNVNGHVTPKSESVGVDEPLKSNGGESKLSEEENEEVKNKEDDLKESSISEKKVTESEECSDSVQVKSDKDFTEAVKEIQILFERASNSGSEILEMLDVGKLRYHPKIDLNPGKLGVNILILKF